jgi:hypothetical protein
LSECCLELKRFRKWIASVAVDRLAVKKTPVIPSHSRTTCMNIATSREAPADDAHQPDNAPTDSGLYRGNYIRTRPLPDRVPTAANRASRNKKCRTKPREEGIARKRQPAAANPGQLPSPPGAAGERRQTCRSIPAVSGSARMEMRWSP